MKKLGFFIVALAMLVVMTGFVAAERNDPATPEIQGISTATSVQAQGTVTEADSLAWTLAANMTPGMGNQMAIGIGAPLTDSKVQYTTGYNNYVNAVSGQTTFAKTMAVSTANKIADQSNVAAHTDLQFIAIDTGRATSTEDILVDGVANATSTSEAILCPFASAASAVIPPYCNIVQAGSSIDTTLTSTVTNANDRFVGTDSTAPVALNYNIASKGITLSDGTSSPMIGSASAYLKVHIQEARNSSTTKSEDLVYSETSTASGLINSFSKGFAFQGGFNLI
jgi:hypothetical protein